MSNPNGEALVTTGSDGVRKATAVAATATTSTIRLDPTSGYMVFLDVTGPTDVSLQATMDSPHSVAQGRANFTTAKGKTNNTAGGLLCVLPKGVTGLKVTQTKNGAGTDDATGVAALGGRSVVRCVPLQGGAGDGKTGVTDYTAITLT